MIIPLNTRICGVTVVSIAGDGKEVIRHGLDAARELAEMQPGVFFVFATAYPEFALDADIFQ